MERLRRLAPVFFTLCSVLCAPCRQERCACVVTRAVASLTLARNAAHKLRLASIAGMIERAAVEESTSLAATAAETLSSMEHACAVSCRRGCRGCRVSRLINQTRAFHDGVDRASEMAFFADGEETVGKLPRLLEEQAKLGAEIVDDLISLGRHCPKAKAERAERAQADERMAT